MTTSVTVVGAGLAGLTTARELTRLGAEVTVLEATERVGGRTRTARRALRGNEHADLGASWIDIGQDAILGLCRELGVRLTPTQTFFPAESHPVRSEAELLRNPVFVDGARLGGNARAADELKAAFEATPPREGETMTAWARRVRLSEHTARVFEGLAGANPVDVPWRTPASLWQYPSVGHTAWMLADGTDSIAQAMAAELDVRLAEPVHLIQRTGGRYEIETERGSHRADYVVLAVSPRAAAGIGFDPPLPEWKTTALLSTPMGQGGKIVVQYDNGEAILAAMPHGILGTSPLSFVFPRLGTEPGTAVVIALIPDTPTLRSPEGHEALLARIDAMVADVTGLEPTRLGSVVQDWSAEPYAGGTVSVMFGVAEELTAALVEPVGRIHFAGEHTGYRWRTGMEAAILSGRRVAREISAGSPGGLTNRKTHA